MIYPRRARLTRQPWLPPLRAARLTAARHMSKALLQEVLLILDREDEGAAALAAGDLSVG